MIRYKKYKKQIFILIITLVFSILTPYNNTAVFSSETKNDLSIDKEYSGFKLIENKTLNEIDSNFKLFKHEKSGAELVFVDNDDTNKIFSIAFKTPAENDMGIPHIVEHSVFCGSEKFNAKHTLLAMKQRSLATHINAATDDLYTYYTISSQNNKDFRNLMDVYLDAVFNPNFINNPYIFKQEGINYSINSSEDEITYNGIVYNEMKKFYTNPYFLLNTVITKSLYPDTPYNYASGGNPDDIVKLTYDMVVQYYEKYYHPSNSIIYLYGDLNISETLKFIDNNYLNSFQDKNINCSVKMQEKFNERSEMNQIYGIPANEDETNKAYLALSFVTGNFEDKEENVAMDLICAYLNSTDSPLKMAFREAGLGENIYTSFNLKVQPYFSFILENASLSDTEKFNDAVLKSLNEIIENGLDERVITSIIKNCEINIQTNKTDAYRGYYYQEKILDSWACGDDLSLYIEIDEVLNDIKGKISTDYFKNLILKYLINNEYSSLVTLEPNAGLQIKKDMETKQYLDTYKKSLTKEELNNLIESNNILKVKQETPETLESMPIISLSDIDCDLEEPIQIKDNIEGATILYTPIFTDKLSYINLYFDSRRVPEDKLSYLYLIQYLLGNVSTENYSYSELSEKIMLEAGSMNFAVSNYKDFNNINAYYPKFEISTFTLTEELPNTFKLIEEIINNSKFNDIERLKEIIHVIKCTFNKPNYNFIANQRLQSYFSEAAKYNEIGGLEFYEFICEIEELLKTNPQKVVKNIEEISKLVFPKQNLIVGVTTSKEDYCKFVEPFKEFSQNLSYVSTPIQKYEFEDSVSNEGFYSKSQVQYTAKGYNLKELGYEFDGKMFVLANVIDEFLFNKIRMMGGAYRGDAKIIPTGEVIFSSSQDPNLIQTFNIYDEISDYIKEFSADERQMENYIIGTYGKLNPLLNPSQKGIVAEEKYIIGYSYEQEQKILKEIMSTTVEDIRSYYKLIENIVNKDFICVIGTENKIEESKDIFNKTLPLFQY